MLNDAFIFYSMVYYYILTKWFWFATSLEFPMYCIQKWNQQIINVYNYKSILSQDRSQLCDDVKQLNFQSNTQDTTKPPKFHNLLSKKICCRKWRCHYQNVHRFI